MYNLPIFDGTDSLGKGPMTGNGKGFCILMSDIERPDKVDGYFGLQGEEYSKKLTDSMSVNNYLHSRWLFRVVKEKVSILDTNSLNFLL